MRPRFLVKCLALAILLGGFALGGARADFQTGSTLLANCDKADDDIALAYCIGYLTAIADVIGPGDEVFHWSGILPVVAAVLALKQSAH